MNSKPESPAQTHTQQQQQQQQQPFKTRILPIDPSKLGQFIFITNPHNSNNPTNKRCFLKDWAIEFSPTSADAAHLLAAASQLRSGDIPVAFPTETVYGLGADATRASAVLGIYAAKQRPSDNPLIVHVSSLTQLRRLLRPDYYGNRSGRSSRRSRDNENENDSGSGSDDDPIPRIYHRLIARFWPGALTILLPLPNPSPLAPQVTASLATFAVRMPSSELALALIHAANVPLAAPSANASTKPSPTTAAHVLHDLDGRIETILDGGPCDIGLESTVVDGLSKPPVVLRPGGVPIESLRECPGWEDVVVGYKDGAETGSGVPRAPGMKYKHYSPKAKLVLVEGALKAGLVASFLPDGGTVGALGTGGWKEGDLLRETIEPGAARATNGNSAIPTSYTNHSPTTSSEIETPHSSPTAVFLQRRLDQRVDSTAVWFIALGPSVADIAHGLFSALRELDLKGVDFIFVEKMEGAGEAGAAVMNRLRKAAEMELKS